MRYLIRGQCISRDAIVRSTISLGYSSTSGSQGTARAAYPWRTSANHASHKPATAPTPNIVFHNMLADKEILMLCALKICFWRCPVLGRMGGRLEFGQSTWHVLDGKEVGLITTRLYFLRVRSNLCPNSLFCHPVSACQPRPTLDLLADSGLISPQLARSDLRLPPRKHARMFSLYLFRRLNA